MANKQENVFNRKKRREPGNFSKLHRLNTYSKERGKQSVKNENDGVLIVRGIAASKLKHIIKERSQNSPYPQQGTTNKRLIKSASNIPQRSMSSLFSRSSTHPPRRPHTSLGQRTNKQCPRGFDLEEHVRRCGSVSGIRIGVNGCSSSSDVYLDRYYEENEVLNTPRKAEKSSPQIKIMKKEEEEDNDDNLSTVRDSSLLWSQNHESDINKVSLPDVSTIDFVPLCWEDQFEKTERAQHRDLISCQDAQQTLSTTMTVPCFKHSLNLTDNIYVTVWWNDSCLLKKTPLKKLQYIESKTEMPPFIPRHKEFVVPCPSLVPELDDEDTKDEMISMENCKVVSTYLDDSLPHSENILPSQEEVKIKKEGVRHEDFTDHLCILCNCSDSNILKPPGSTPSILAMMQSTVKARAISTTKCIIPIKIDSVSIHNNHLHLVIVSDSRSLSFSMNVDFSGLSHHDKRSLLGGTESHRGNAVFSEHVNYYNIEDDEDKTDMDALSLQFPDLRLVELIKDHFPYQTPHSHRRTHTERGTTKFIGKTILPMTKLGKSVTSFNSKDPTKYQVRSIYRPSQRETSSYSTQRSYTSIVNQQLKPYIRRRNNSAS